MENLKTLNPVLLAFLANVLTWFTTMLGAAVVVFQKKPSRKVFDCSLGFAGGIMVSASFFSLILPAIEISKGYFFPGWMVITIGFVLGSFFIFALDKIIPHLHPNLPYSEKEGIKIDVSFTYLLVMAIVLHNIPEGLAVGVAFGSFEAGAQGVTFTSSLALTVALALHNIPEGMAVSIPLRGTGMSRRRAFWFGQMSGMVLPIGGVIGAVAVKFFRPLMPYALAFAAGAMIYVVVEEVIPETQRAGNTDIATLSFLTGFVLMMIFNIAFA